MKNIKKIISLVIGICMLISSLAVGAAAANNYTYLGDMYTFTSTNSSNTYTFTDAQAYTEKVSLHLVHGDNADPLKMQIGTGDGRIAMSTSYGGMVEPTITFKAKGTLPTSATLSCGWTNGSINATRDVTWSEGEADANGWRDVRFNMGHLTLNNAGMYGGHAIFTLSINGSADFYMDDINLSYTPWTSGWAAGANVANMLSAHDNSFENAEMIVPESSYPYLGTMYTLTSTNGDNTYAFTDAQAYTEKISLHIMHGNNADPLKLQIGTGDGRLPMSTSYGGMVEPTITFKAKGTLPTSATLSCGWTNGSVNATRDVTWSEGAADENGWRDVRFNMGHLTLNNAGMYGGNSVFTLSINGSADFYMDDINLSYTPWTSGWVAGANVANMLSAHDNSFENVKLPVEDKEYSSERTTYIMNHGEYTVSGATENNWYSFTDEEAKTGSKSLHLVHKKDNEDTLSFVVNHDGRLFNVGGYATTMNATFKFYAKGLVPESANLKLTYTNGNLVYSVDSSAWTVGAEDANGWKLVTVSGAGNFGNLYGGLINATMNITGQCDMYIDDISLDWTQSGTSAELLSKYGYDTSFENVKYQVSNVATEKENIRSLTYDWSADSIQLSWKNPANDNIKAIKVLQDGVDITGATEFDLTSMATNKFDVSGLAANAGYDFTVVVTTDKSEASQSVTAYTNNERNWVRLTHDKYPFGDGSWNPYWSATSDGTGFNTNIGFYIDTTEKYSGQSSLKLVSNNQSKANQYMYMLHPMANLDTASKYTFSFMGKAVDTGKMGMSVNFGNSNTYTTGISIGESGYLFNDGWREYSVEIAAPATASDSLRIELNGACDAFYIDNMKLVKTGDTTNLIKNGGFEYEVSSVAFDEATKTLTWVADEEPWTNYVIYKIDPRTGNNVEVAAFAPADLTEGKKYVDSALSANSMYTVKTYFNEYGIGWTSDGVATANWDITYPAFDTVSFGSEFNEYGENAEIIGEALSINAAGGNYMSSVGINNVDADAALDLNFFTALYKDNVLVDVVTLDSTFDAGSTPAAFRGVINVPATSGEEVYVLKTFVWNGSTMAPVTEVGSISSAQ